MRLEHLAGVTGFNSRPGFCRRGARAWFARHGLDWDRFRKHGVEASALLATGDALAAALVEHATKMEKARGRQQ